MGHFRILLEKCNVLTNGNPWPELMGVEAEHLGRHLRVAATGAHMAMFKSLSDSTMSDPTEWRRGNWLLSEASFFGGRIYTVLLQCWMLIFLLFVLVVESVLSNHITVCFQIMCLKVKKLRLEMLTSGSTYDQGEEHEVEQGRERNC